MSALLEQWGKWARHNPDRLGCKSNWLIVMRNNVQTSSNILRYDITDDEASVVDNAVTKLAKYSLMQHRAVVCHFVYGYPVRRLGKVLSRPEQPVSRHQAEKFLNQGIGYVEALLVEAMV